MTLTLVLLLIVCLIYFGCTRGLGQSQLGPDTLQEELLGRKALTIPIRGFSKDGRQFKTLFIAENTPVALARGEGTLMTRNTNPRLLGEERQTFIFSSDTFLEVSLSTGCEDGIGLRFHGAISRKNRRP